MRVMNERCAGLDVHQKTVVACALRGPAGSDPELDRRTWATTTSPLLELNDWLRERGITHVAMESTAQYGRPVWYGLEPHFRLHLTHPLKTRAPRGRKSDFRDAQR